MALTMYDRGFIFANGALLGESMGGTVEYQGDPIPVETLSKDLAGFTPVPKRCVVSVDTFVPAPGFEFDAIKKFLNNEFLTIKVQFGGSGLAMSADGMMNAPSLSFSATDATKMSFKITCEAKGFE